MAALDFPASSSSPWTDPNGAVWVWNGTGWAQKIPFSRKEFDILYCAFFVVNYSHLLHIFLFFDLKYINFKNMNYYCYLIF